MPRSLMIKIMFFSIPSLLVAATTYYYLKSEKPSHLQQLKRPPLLSSFTSKGVTTKLIRVEIEAEPAKKHDEVIEVKAFVTVPYSPTGSLNYKWKFGEKVEIVEGDTNGSIQDLKPNETKMIYIKVKGYSSESNRHIGFEVHGQHAGRAIYGDSLIASDLENTFENIVQNVERIKSEK